MRPWLQSLWCFHTARLAKNLKWSWNTFWLTMFCHPITFHLNLKTMKREVCQGVWKGPGYWTEKNIFRLQITKQGTNAGKAERLSSTVHNQLTKRCFSKSWNLISVMVCAMTCSCSSCLNLSKELSMWVFHRVLKENQSNEKRVSFFKETNTAPQRLNIWCLNYQNLHFHILHPSRKKKVSYLKNLSLLKIDQELYKMASSCWSPIPAYLRGTYFMPYVCAVIILSTQLHPQQQHPFCKLLIGSYCLWKVVKTVRSEMPVSGTLQLLVSDRKHLPCLHVACIVFKHNGPPPKKLYASCGRFSVIDSKIK